MAWLAMMVSRTCFVLGGLSAVAEEDSEDQEQDSFVLEKVMARVADCTCRGHANPVAGCVPPIVV